MHSTHSTALAAWHAQHGTLHHVIQDHSCHVQCSSSPQCNKASLISIQRAFQSKQQWNQIAFQDLEVCWLRICRALRSHPSQVSPKISPQCRKPFYRPPALFSLEIYTVQSNISLKKGIFLNPEKLGCLTQKSDTPQHWVRAVLPVSCHGTMLNISSDMLKTQILPWQPTLHPRTQSG